MCELQPFHGAVVGCGERAFVFKRESADSAFSYAIRKGHTDCIVLTDAFGGKCATVAIDYAGDAQTVV